MGKVIIVSGASRGLGRAIVVSFAKSFPCPVFFILLGRDADGLNRTEQLIRAARPGLKSNFELVVCDLSNLLCLQSTFGRIFDLILTNSAAIYDDVTLINNAGSLGPLAAVGSCTIVNEDITSAINLNVTSFMIITNEFIKW